MNTPSFFITGTDTGVGKTFVTAAMLAALRKGGQNVVPMKPIQTGCMFGKSGGLESPDLDFCLTVAGLVAGDADTYRAMCPYLFSLAASPHMAARTENVEVSIDTIVASYKQLRSSHDGVLVEGAGGALTPVSDTHFMTDVMKALGLPVLLIARPGLGTLNHTLLSVHEIQRAGVEVAAVILNKSTDAPLGPIEDDNFHTLQRMSGVKAVFRFPFIAFMPKPRFAQTATEVFGKALFAA